MRHKTYVHMNDDHYAKVVVARRAFNDVQDAKVIQYVESTPQVVSHVNDKFKQRFMEAL